MTTYNLLIYNMGEFASSGYINQLDFDYLSDSSEPWEYENAIANLPSTDMTINNLYNFEAQSRMVGSTVTVEAAATSIYTSIEPDINYAPTVTYLEATIDNVQAAAYSEAEGNGLQSKYGFTSGSTVGDIYTDSLLALTAEMDWAMLEQRQAFPRLKHAMLHPTELSSFGNIAFQLEQVRMEEYKELLFELINDGTST